MWLEGSYECMYVCGYMFKLQLVHRIQEVHDDSGGDISLLSLP